MSAAAIAWSSSPGGVAAGAISIRSLNKTYRSRHGELTHALHDITLEIRPGELISVVGPSGCGKTTLLRVLAGLIPRTDGSVQLNGREVSGPQKQIGVVFQAPTLLPWRTVLENVLLPAQLQRRDIRAAKARAHELLELVGLADFATAYPYELSGGMQQRAGICRSLVNDPEVLLMDEPFAALDAMTREYMAVEFQRIWLASRKTVVFITHSITEAVFLADRIAVMTPRPGRIAEVIRVGFERPRALSILQSEAAGAYVSRVRQHFGASVVT